VSGKQLFGVLWRQFGARHHKADLAGLFALDRTACGSDEINQSAKVYFNANVSFFVLFQTPTNAPPALRVMNTQLAPILKATTLALATGTSLATEYRAPVSDRLLLFS